MVTSHLFSISKWLWESVLIWLFGKQKLVAGDDTLGNNVSKMQILGSLCVTVQEKQGEMQKTAPSKTELHGNTHACTRAPSVRRGWVTLTQVWCHNLPSDSSSSSAQLSPSLINTTLPTPTSTGSLQVLFEVKCHIYYNVHVFVNHLTCKPVLFLLGSYLYS